MQFTAAIDDVAAPEQISFVHAARSLAAFQTVAFRSDDSAFDRFLAGDGTALDPAQLQGLELFFGEAGCAGCHSGPLLTDHAFHAIAVPQIGPGKGHGEDTGYWRRAGFGTHLEDEGRYRVTFDPEDLFAFRTPSLRNVALTGPWGHDGAFSHLEDVVRHHLDSVASLQSYAVNEDALPKLGAVIEKTGQDSALIFRPLNPGRRAAFDLRDSWVQSSPALRRRIAAESDLPPQPLNDEEIAAMLAFLDVLTDPSAIDRSDLIPACVLSGLPPQPAPATSH